MTDSRPLCEEPDRLTELFSLYEPAYRDRDSAATSGTRRVDIPLLFDCHASNGPTESHQRTRGACAVTPLDSATSPSTANANCWTADC